MADRLAFGDFRFDRAGVVAALKSPGVVSLVAEHAERLCAAANAAARDRLTAEERDRLEHAEPGCMGAPPYEAVVKEGRSDTLGVVRSASLWGAYDSNQHHTLDSLNH